MGGGRRVLFSFWVSARGFLKVHVMKDSFSPSVNCNTNGQRHDLVRIQHTKNNNETSNSHLQRLEVIISSHYVSLFVVKPVRRSH